MSRNTWNVVTLLQLDIIDKNHPLRMLQPDNVKYSVCTLVCGTYSIMCAYLDKEDLKYNFVSNRIMEATRAASCSSN